MIDPTIRFIDAIRSVAENDLTVEEMAMTIHLLMPPIGGLQTLKSAISRLQEVADMVESFRWRGN